MKIWIVSRGCPSEQNPQYGIFEFDQARALKTAGFEVIFLALDLRSIRRWRKWGIHTFVKEGISVVEINVPYGPIPYKLYDMVGRKAFKRLFYKAVKLYGKPDIVHAHFGNVASLCADCVTAEKIKFIVTEHHCKIMEEPMVPKVYRAASCAYSKADKVIAVSGALAKRIYEKFGVKAEVVANIIDENNFSLEKMPHKDASQDFMFCTCGNLIHRKGFDIILKAFSVMKNQSSKLIIIGDGPCRHKLEELVNDLGIIQRVEFKGRCTRDVIRDIYRNCDCFVLSSRSETFGVVYIEALASGLPIIATRCGGPEDIVTDEIGVLIDVDDVEGLAEAMDDMIQNYQKYDKDYCVEYVKKRFSGEEICTRLEEIYK